MSAHATKQGGFTLVEIALALMVAALGVVGVFALIPQALDASRKSVEATEAAVFASFVFEALEPLATDTNEDWVTFNNSLELNPSHALQLTNYVVATGPNEAAAEMYPWRPSFYGESGGGASVGQALYLTNYAVAAFTYTLDIGVTSGDRKYARLEVWPGDKKAAVRSGTAVAGSTVYYREFIPML